MVLYFYHSPISHHHLFSPSLSDAHNFLHHTNQTCPSPTLQFTCKIHVPTILAKRISFMLILKSLFSTKPHQRLPNFFHPSPIRGCQILFRLDLHPPSSGSNDGPFKCLYSLSSKQLIVCACVYVYVCVCIGDGRVGGCRYFGWIHTFVLM